MDKILLKILDMSRPFNDDVFRAVAHPVRRRVIELLRTRDRSVGEIADQVAMSNPTVSQHLRVLRETGVVRQRRDRNRRVYSLDRRAVRFVHAWSGRVT